MHAHALLKFIVAQTQESLPQTDSKSRTRQITDHQMPDSRQVLSMTLVRFQVQVDIPAKTNHRRSLYRLVIGPSDKNQRGAQDRFSWQSEQSVRVWGVHTSTSKIDALRSLCCILCCGFFRRRRSGTLPLVTHKLVCDVCEARKETARDRAPCGIIKTAEISRQGVQQGEIGFRLRVRGLVDNHVEENKHCREGKGSKYPDFQLAFSLAICCSSQGPAEAGSCTYHKGVYGRTSTHRVRRATALALSIRSFSAALILASCASSLVLFLPTFNSSLPRAIDKAW